MYDLWEYMYILLTIKQQQFLKVKIKYLFVNSI